MTTSSSDDTTRPAPVTVVATMRARAGQQFQLQRVLASLIKQTRRDPGMITYELYQDTADPARFCFLEIWDSAEAHQQHVDQPHITAFTSREAELVDDEGILVHRLRLLDRC